MAKIKIKEIKNEHVVVKVENNKIPSVSDNTYIGCTIDICETSRKWISFNAEFVDSQICFKKKQTNFELTDNRFIRCKFKGTISGCSFGSMKTVVQRASKGGSQIDCDFRDAIVTESRFIEEFPETLKLDKDLLPRWPHSFFIAGECDFEMLRSLKWPESVQDIIETILSDFLGDDYSPAVRFLHATVTCWTQHTKDEKELSIIRRNLEKAKVFL